MRSNGKTPIINMAKREKKIKIFIVLIATSLIFTFFGIGAYYNRNRAKYAAYKESSNINYVVSLKDNNYFEEDYLEKDQTYISTLIKNISALFEYKLSFKDKIVDYHYSYYIESVVNVKEKTSFSSLYNKTETILDTITQSTSANQLEIQENVEIDYNKYNDLMQGFVNVYDLDEVESTLTINMHVVVLGECQDFSENQYEKSVISLSIPLTTKTVEIELSNNLVNTENRIELCESCKKCFIPLIFASICFIFALSLTIYLLRFAISTRTPEIKYYKDLNKIKFNYGSYIQVLDSKLDLTKYEVLKVNSFNDLLEIRDTIRQPILLSEDKEKNRASFITFLNANSLYAFTLSVNDNVIDTQSDNQELNTPNANLKDELSNQETIKNSSKHIQNTDKTLMDKELIHAEANTQETDNEFNTEDIDDKIDMNDDNENPNKIDLIPKKTFSEKLLLMSDQSKEYYSCIKNELLRYKSHDRLSKSCETFKNKGTLAKLAVGGKTLKLYLALNPNNSNFAAYGLEDMAYKKHYALVPAMIRIKNIKALNRALELIQIMMSEREIKPKKNYVATDFTIELKNK